MKEFKLSEKDEKIILEQATNGTWSEAMTSEEILAFNESIRQEIIRKNNENT